ncbi:MAG: IS1634 family transposase [Solirubrobacterales bacterium]
MYLRRTQRRRKDGSVVGYLQLAHNRRVGGVTRAEVLLNLGREDRADVEGLGRLARSITRYAEGADPVGAVAARAPEELRVTDARPLGAAWVLDALWRRLRIERAISEALSGRRHRHDVERVIFALVANRAIAPASKLAAAEWVTHDAAIPGLSEIDDDRAYRAMDVLAAADAEGAVQEAVFFSVADLLNLEVDLLFFDTTSTYFEIEDEDEGVEGDRGPESVRRFGHSKDHRPDRPQIVVGLAVTRTGIPVRVWVFPGNTADQSVVERVKSDLAGWRLGRAVWVVDRGLSSEENLRYLRRGGGHWIAGMRMRAGEEACEAALARQGRYRTVRDNLRVKEVRLGSGEAERRFIVCHNPEEEGRDRTRRERALRRIEAELERIERLRSRAGKAGTAHERAECALRDHPSHSRYLRQLPSGRLRIDRAKVRAEERLDGKFLLETSDPEITAEDAALGYKNLLEAERSFRDLKGTLRIRPIFHRLEERIRAHVVICWLALLLIRIAERETGETWRRMRTELERLKLVTLSGPAGAVEQTTPPTDAQRAILGQLQIAPPPAVTALRPA